MAKKRSSPKKAAAPLGPETRVLILCGPEDMLKREHLAELRDAIDKEAGEAIDPASFDGKTAEPAAVFDELRTLSLLQSYRLVIVENADEFVKKHRPLVERYAEHPAEGATLVLRSVNWNSPKLDKLVAKVGVKHKCESPKAHEAQAWLIKRAKSEHGRVLDKVAAGALVDRLGCSLMRLDSEVAKLALMVGEGETIDKSMIDQVVGRGSDEQAYAVQEAVLEGLLRGESRNDGHDGGGAIEMLHELIDLSGQPDVLVMYFVADLVRKLHLAQHMLRQRVPAGAIGKELKLWGPRRDMFFNVLRRLDADATARMLEHIVQLDARSKSGFGNATRNLECFCAALADEMN